MGQTIDWALETCDLRFASDMPGSWTGLSAGGLRINPGSTLAEAERLAGLMTLKLAVCRVPVGGAKTVAVPRPGAERSRMLDEIAGALAPLLASGYLLGEDLGTTSADVVAIYRASGVDPVAMVAGHNAERGITMDVPAGLQVGDLMNDEFAGVLAGTGAVAALVAALDGASLAGLTAAVQGFGTVGQAAAAEFVRRGGTVVTLVDAEGFVHDPDGLPVAGLAGPTRGIIDRSRLPESVETGPLDRWATLPADVLVPAAVSGAITADDVSAVHPSVRYVVEGANDPVTVAAELALEAAGVVVIPDFVANAGSAIAFGMLATGQAGVGDILDQYLERIGDAVRRCLAHEDLGFRAAAEAEARDFLAETVTSVGGA